MDRNWTLWHPACRPSHAHPLLEPPQGFEDVPRDVLEYAHCPKPKPKPKPKPEPKPKPKPKPKPESNPKPKPNPNPNQVRTLPGHAIS